MSPKVFISYRRDDSIATTGRIYDRLIGAFGEANVFQDVEKLPVGVDFRKYLHDQIVSSDVVLAVIGKSWLSIQDEFGRKRLENPADFVRIEIENALRQDKFLIPVLVDGAMLPSASDLPETLHDLCYRNAAKVRHNPDFNRDVHDLIEGIRRHFGGVQATSQTVVAQDPVSTAQISGYAPWQPRTPEKPRVLRVEDILQPPFEWCEIPAGDVTVNFGKWSKDGAGKETYSIHERRHAYLPQFEIAKYPITNSQYETFLRSSDGYSDDKWWDFSENAAEWRTRKLSPEHPGFPGDDHPRTKITWYEAVAFCRWLSSKTGNEIALQDEQQWQRAAQGDDGRKYPWGDKWDDGRCNYAKESGEWSTTPVIQYQSGVSPFKVHDLVGNVYEFCSNDYLTGRVALYAHEQIVVRGGSCRYFPSDHLTNIARFMCPRSFFNDDVGFRIVRIKK